jgi:hypothetical protein
LVLQEPGVQEKRLEDFLLPPSLPVLGSDPSSHSGSHWPPKALCSLTISPEGGVLGRVSQDHREDEDLCEVFLGKPRRGMGKARIWGPWRLDKDVTP